MSFKFRFLGLISLLLLLGACSRTPTMKKQLTDNHGVMSQNQTATIVEATPLSTVDISKVSSFNKLRSSTEGLYRLGKNGRVDPGLATAVKISHGATVYDFTIRDNARWSNGAPITASDFVYSWKRTIAKSTKSVNANLLSGIKNASKIRRGQLPASALGVQAVSNHHLRVTLDHPITYFKTLLAFPLFAPQSSTMVAKYGAQYGKRATTQLYSGPFKLVKWHSGSLTRTLVPNPYYWDKAHVYLHRLTITTSKSPAADLASFQAHHADEIQLSGNQIPKVETQPDYVVRPFSAMRFISYNFNTTNQQAKKLLQNRNARLAISHAINRRQLINNALKNASLPPRGLVTAGLSKNPQTGSDFADQQRAVNRVKGNLKLAQQEWQLAQKQTGKTHQTLTLTTPNDATSLQVSKEIKAQLTKNLPGLRIKLVTGSFTENNQRGLAGDFELFLSYWGADYPDPLSFLQIMTTRSRHNYGHWENERYNDLVTKVSSSNLSAIDRWNTMLTAEEVLMKDQGVTPLYQQATSYLTNPKLNGVIHNSSGVASDYKQAYMVK